MSYPVLDFSSIGINVTPRIRNAESHTTTTRRFSFYYGAKNGGELMLRVAKRRHLRPNAVSLELPLLPFNTNEVLVPSETKTLHLYEARYLALLEESLLRKKLFVHFVLDPISIGNSGAEASFAARYGCLVFIESIERLDVGALVSIRGIGRVKILKFLQAEPYLKGEVRPKQDEVLDGTTNLTSKILQLKEALHSLNKLEIKLKERGSVLQIRLPRDLACIYSQRDTLFFLASSFISVPKRLLLGNSSHKQRLVEGTH